MTAEIDGISDKWSSKAAAMDAFTRVNHESPFIAFWLDEKGYPCWSKANMTFQQQAAISAHINEMVRLWARQIIDCKDDMG